MLSRTVKHGSNLPITLKRSYKNHKNNDYNEKGNETGSETGLRFMAPSIKTLFY